MGHAEHAPRTHRAPLGSRLGGLIVPAASYSPTGCAAVPSALEGLTAQFGMGWGVTPPPSPPKFAFGASRVGAPYEHPLPSPLPVAALRERGSVPPLPRLALDALAGVGRPALEQWNIGLPRASGRNRAIGLVMVVLLVRRPSAKNYGQASRAISTGQLHALQRFHPPPINLVVYEGPSGAYAQGFLILGSASRLDAFSGYPIRTWLPGGATGVTTGTPGVRPPRSSRTKGRSPQESSAHDR